MNNKQIIHKGIDKKSLRFINHSVGKDRTVSGGKLIWTGYKGTANIELTENWSHKLNEQLLKSLSEIGKDITYKVRFSLSENQKKRIRKIALEKAIDDAYIKANVIATKSNLNLGEINKILYDTWDAPGRFLLDSDILEEGNYSSVILRGSREPLNYDINPKEIAIVKFVNIEWNIKRE